MAIRYYDEALTNKIKNAVGTNDSILILSPEESSEELFSDKADLNYDKLSLPMISLIRKRDTDILNTNKKPLTYDGIKLPFYDKNGNKVEGDKALKLNAIPIKIEYQLDIYTKKEYEADEFAREFLFYFINNPNVTIEIPYNGIKTTHKSTVRVESPLINNSDIPQKLFKDQFYRYSLNLYIDDAYYFSVPSMKTILIDITEVEVIDKNGNIIEKTTQKSNIK